MAKKAAKRDVTPEASEVAAPIDSDGAGLLDRDLSWLDFNSRVLALAEDPAVPLLERLKFLAIFSANLDEFFMIRVAGLAGRVAAGLGAAAAGGLEPAAQLKAIRARVLELVAQQTAIFDALVPALAEADIRLGGPQGIEKAHRDEINQRFEEHLFPVLTPLAVDPGHPFPYISNLSLNLAVMVRDGRDGQRRFARVKVPPLLSRFQPTADGARLYPLEQVIADHLPMLFPGMQIESAHPFRVTRNADLMVGDEEADDLLAAVEMQVRQRRFGRAVRLEVDAGMPAGVRELLLRELQLGADDLYEIDHLLDLGSLAELYAVNRPELKYPPWTPVLPEGLGAAAGDIFTVLRSRDILLHHPYDSFGAVEAFIDQAATDPDVLAIKQTMYRTSLESAIPRALIRAAEAGKQVAVLVELTARFSEEVNIAWARRLEEAGVHVVYGLVGLKTGCKATLVVRRERGELRRYCHLGTGNYDATTARQYEDVGLLTGDEAIGADLSDLFNYLTGYSRRNDYRKLAVAPVEFRQQILKLIRECSSASGRIAMKMNNLVDDEVIEALYQASSAGCEIDLVIRGICRLCPGVPGRSERIRVRSIVGRYLEHSRIFAFGQGDGSTRYFIGSADLTPSNLDRRVQILCPVEDGGLAARLEEILAVNLADTSSGWALGPDGAWTPIPAATEGVAGRSTHGEFQGLAGQRQR
ncbi:MAG TPA: polyphosphate kinase 1 [Acidimicrobiia bacterium]|nr:polyphosphate kinase 1 [Acidimicrobiia bacterium]